MAEALKISLAQMYLPSQIFQSTELKIHFKRKKKRKNLHIHTQNQKHQYLLRTAVSETPKQTTRMVPHDAQVNSLNNHILHNIYTCLLLSKRQAMYNFMYKQHNLKAILSEVMKLKADSACGGEE